VLFQLSYRPNGCQSSCARAGESVRKARRISALTIGRHDVADGVHDDLRLVVVDVVARVVDLYERAPEEGKRDDEWPDAPKRTAIGPPV
jgi:hypothetical protein